ncbi:hypothetical protein N184_34045 [Sinorhizobium sp. GL28]|nr:hypothetical protein N184_34045 [Sinorhizobium sp. GL28]
MRAILLRPWYRGRAEAIFAQVLIQKIVGAKTDDIWHYAPPFGGDGALGFLLITVGPGLAP